MASGSDSTGSSNFDPDFTAGWHTDRDISQPDLDFPITGNASLLEETFEHPSPSFLGGFRLDFPFGTQQDALPWQAAEQHNLPSPSDVPGPSGFQPRAATTPFDGNLRNRDACRGGLTGAGLRVTEDTHSFIVVPQIPPTPPLPLATTFPANWVMVPQEEYGHGRKQFSFKRREPVSFSVCGRPGINLGAALRGDLENLDGLDDPVLHGASGAISCRFLFPGYPVNGGVFQIHAWNWKTRRQPVKRAKLAHEIAKRLERYLRNMAKFTPDRPVEDRWKVGRGFMQIDNMFLVRFVSVSKGSFQPEIWVADSLMSHPLSLE